VPEREEWYVYDFLSGIENGDWAKAGFSLDAVVDTLRGYSKGYYGPYGWQSQRVWWDNVE